MFEGVIDREEFAQRLWSGDPDTYDFVWRESQGPLIAFLRVSFRLSLEDAEDLVSLCWIKIRSSCCRTYDPNVGPFAPWLKAIAANLAKDLLGDYQERSFTSIDDVEDRLISRDTLIEPEAVTSDIGDQEESGDRRFELLEEAKRSVRKTDLEAISLHYEHEYTYSRMSRILGISTAAAGMRVTRAVKRLRAEVKRLQSHEPRPRNRGPDEEDSP